MLATLKNPILLSILFLYFSTSLNSLKKSQSSKTLPLYYHYQSHTILITTRIIGLPHVIEYDFLKSIHKLS